MKSNLFKKNAIYALIGFCIVFASCSTPIQHDLVISNINIIDVETGKVIQNQTVAIDSNRISEIYSKKNDFSVSTQIIDGDGKFMTPALCDNHMHISLLTSYGGDTLQNELIEFIRKGVLYFRDVGGPVDVLQELKSKISSGKLVGPDIYFTGPMLETGPLHWEKHNEKLPGFTVSLDTRKDVDSLLPVLAEKGASMIKTFNNINAELYPYIVDVARKYNLKVVHDPGLALLNQVPINKALELGVTSIEHSTPAWCYILKDKYRAEHETLLQQDSNLQQRRTFMSKMADVGIETISEDRLRALCTLMKEKNAVYCPTLGVFNSRLLRIEEQIANGNNDEMLIKEKNIWNNFAIIGNYIVRKFSENGVKLLVGQDNIVPEGTVKEMIFMNKAGVSNIEVLRGATLYAAEWLGLTEKYGSIKPSKRADMLILNTNPLDDIANMNDLFMVIQHGKIVNQ
ncbi:amidohydrolase family protein [Carboxylicivirga marina]|uniref:Amidohydrolase family protein n=1 Tax=Carboxylicivirga marina TaxID=2800988 RepID=A0ABS1HEC9_9BACT|nr:amidohydrolase family protein [Carboxylicivirga marina]MBK3515971.1 amidohydrolase family protein [Carboxylicivirga marina]